MSIIKVPIIEQHAREPPVLVSNRPRRPRAGRASSATSACARADERARRRRRRPSLTPTSRDVDVTITILVRRIAPVVDGITTAARGVVPDHRARAQRCAIVVIVSTSLARHASASTDSTRPNATIDATDRPSRSRRSFDDDVSRDGRSVARARSSCRRGRDSLVSHTPWYDESMGHERSRVPHRATTAPMDDARMTTADYDASTRDTRRSRRDDRESARVRLSSSDTARTRRERDANETRTRRDATHLESRGGVDRVLVETVPRVSGEKRRHDGGDGEDDVSIVRAGARRGAIRGE